MADRPGLCSFRSHPLSWKGAILRFEPGRKSEKTSRESRARARFGNWSGGLVCVCARALSLFLFSRTPPPHVSSFPLPVEGAQVESGGGREVREGASVRSARACPSGGRPMLGWRELCCSSRSLSLSHPRPRFPRARHETGRPTNQPLPSRLWDGGGASRGA